VQQRVERQRLAAERLQSQLEEVQQTLQRLQEQHAGQTSLALDLVEGMKQEMAQVEQEAKQQWADMHRALDQAQLQRQEIEHLQQHAADAAVWDLCTAIRRTAAPRLQLAGCGWIDCHQQQALVLEWSQEHWQYSAEAAAVGRKATLCGGCGLARYCCPQHQRQDWPRHRHVCRRLAQARAAAGVSSYSGSSNHAV
jgi:hypothetical protein